MAGYVLFSHFLVSNRILYVSPIVVFNSLTTVSAIPRSFCTSDGDAMNILTRFLVSDITIFVVRV